VNLHRWQCGIRFRTAWRNAALTLAASAMVRTSYTAEVCSTSVKNGA